MDITGIDLAAFGTAIGSVNTAVKGFSMFSSGSKRAPIRFKFVRQSALQNVNVSYGAKKTGVGRDAEAAHVKAISKLSASRIQETFAAGK